MCAPPPSLYDSVSSVKHHQHRPAWSYVCSRSLHYLSFAKRLRSRVVNQPREAQKSKQTSPIGNVFRCSRARRLLFRAFDEFHVLVHVHFSVSRGKSDCEQLVRGRSSCGSAAVRLTNPTAPMFSSFFLTFAFRVCNLVLERLSKQTMMFVGLRGRFVGRRRRYRFSVNRLWFRFFVRTME